ncbi:hypothetical protein pdam_00024354 [Pocillopora damicornis]|uniref:Uncharacterized protein n=1 Tax=Pocillopora damicornis TaxID=46731 RepID=A0A3M6U2A5_POCDA|nr:hypothetical protein pdam_00024354 [Pocillopora damicornis]
MSSQDQLITLTFTNSHVSNFLEELGVYQEGHLTQSDEKSHASSVHPLKKTTCPLYLSCPKVPKGKRVHPLQNSSSFARCDGSLFATLHGIIIQFNTYLSHPTNGSPCEMVHRHSVILGAAMILLLLQCVVIDDEQDFPISFGVARIPKRGITNNSDGSQDELVYNSTEIIDELDD